MRKMTTDEFKAMYLEDELGLLGLTDEEIEIYYNIYLFGRMTVKA